MISSVISILFGKELSIFIKIFQEFLSRRFRIKHSPNSWVLKISFDWRSFNSFFSEESSINMGFNQISICEFVTKNNVSDFKGWHINFTILSLDNDPENMDCQLPFFLGVSEPFNDFVSVEILVFKNFFQFSNGVAYTLNEFSHFSWVF